METVFVAHCYFRVAAVFEKKSKNVEVFVLNWYDKRGPAAFWFGVRGLAGLKSPCGYVKVPCPRRVMQKGIAVFVGDAAVNFFEFVKSVSRFFWAS